MRQLLLLAYTSKNLEEAYAAIHIMMGKLGKLSVRVHPAWCESWAFHVIDNPAPQNVCVRCEAYCKFIACACFVPVEVHRACL